MAEYLQLSEATIARLRHFHSQHFPTQPVPTLLELSQAHSLHYEQHSNMKEEDELGYYEDGVKRTLTDDQIAIFRNSEIQRLLAQRRRERETKEELDLQKQSRHIDTTSPKTGRMKHNNYPRRAEVRYAKKDHPQSLTYDDKSIEQETGPMQFIWPNLTS